MLTVTEKAKQQLKEILETHTDDPEVGLRMLREPSGQIELVLSKADNHDQVVEHEGAKVLLLEPDVISLVDNTVLDVQDSVDGPVFFFSQYGNNRN